jgi:CRISPR-associated protein Csm3
MRLEKHEVITGTIHCVSGVRIGGNNNVIEIGTIDNPIIRNPITNLPYLPGSSIKGKMRCSLEQKHQKFSPDRHDSRILGPCACGTCPICKLFGASDVAKVRSPSRLIFRDCQLTQGSLRELEDAAGSSGVFFAEIKPGVRIDRATNTAARKAFYNFERVPAGMDFDFEMVLRLYDLDKQADRDQYHTMIKQGLQLLEKEGIGGKISAGYGQIAIGVYRNVKKENGSGEEEKFVPGTLLWDDKLASFREKS